MLQTSDCVLAIGTELSETDFWDTQIVVDKNLIRIDIDPAAIARPHAAEIPILGDAKETLEALAPLITAKTPQSKPKIAKGEDDALRIMLSKVLGTIREALPEDTVIASDMTQIAYAANIIFPMYVPRTWLHPVGFGTLGFGLPAGIGAKFGVGKKPVAIMIGDYGIQFTINELGTAAEHKLPVVILMWNNNALGQIRDDMVSKGIQPNAVTLKNPDFQMLAKAYGCYAEKPASLKALAVAIKTALGADGPTFIEMTPAMVMAEAAVIFDVDGVLLELTRAEEDAFFVLFERRSADVEAGLSNAVHFIGFSTDPGRLAEITRAGANHTTNNHLDSFRLISQLLQR